MSTAEPAVLSLSPVERERETEGFKVDLLFQWNTADPYLIAEPRLKIAMLNGAESVRDL